jgi:hypothetical protein
MGKLCSRHHFELLKYGFGVLHEHAFGDLELEISRFQASFQEYSSGNFDKTLVAELDGGNVDSNRQWRQPRVLPSACLRTAEVNGLCGLRLLPRRCPGCLASMRPFLGWAGITAYSPKKQPRNSFVFCHHSRRKHHPLL